MNNHNHKPAFTIIEVVLVLAIAGLVFLMVFIALPALQRNQRDTQRRNDMNRLAGALESYKANNRGRLPPYQYAGGSSSSDSEFLDSYLRLDGDEFQDPAGYAYRMRFAAPSQIANERVVGRDMESSIVNRDSYRGHIWVTPSRHCEAGVLFDAGPNQASIQYALESGGVICLNI